MGADQQVARSNCGDQTRTGGTKGIAAGELPHASEQLCEATHEEGHADDDVRVADAADTGVVEGEDQRRRRERKEPTVGAQND